MCPRPVIYGRCRFSVLRAIAAVARCIVFPDVLSFAEDSSAPRVRGQDSCPKRASISRKVLSCWSSSCQYMLGSDFVVLSIVSESRQYLGGKVSRPAFNSPVLGGSISVVFCCDGLLLVTHRFFLVVSWSLSS